MVTTHSQMGTYSMLNPKTENFKKLSILNYRDKSKERDDYYVLLRKARVKLESGWEFGWAYVKAERIGVNSYSWDDEDEDYFVRGNSFFDRRWTQVR